MFGDGFLADPYPALAALRQEGPMHRMEMFGGAWTFTRHADISALLRDARLSARRSDALVFQFSAEQQAELTDFRRLFSQWMLFFDPPEHTRPRRAMSRGFRPAVIADLVARITQVVDGLIDTVEGQGSCDAIADLAHPLPAIVIAEMMAIPAADRQRFMIWSDDVAEFFGRDLATFDIALKAQTGLRELTDYFREVVARRRRQPGEDLISQLLALEAEEALSEEEVWAQCAMLLFAGHETTRNLIGNGLLALLREPAARQRYLERSDLGRTAIDELLRFDSPVQIGSRLVAEEISLHGETIAPGELLIFLLGAANRDPDEFAEPDRLDLTRSPNRHVSFGYGPHLCLGSHLARMEADIVFRRLFTRLPALRLATEDLVWSTNFGFRGLTALPLEF
ncbi:MAG: cytochrome P450 [Acidobacteriota bacterium]